MFRDDERITSPVTDRPQPAGDGSAVQVHQSLSSADTAVADQSQSAVVATASTSGYVAITSHSTSPSPFIKFKLHVR